MTRRIRAIFVAALVVSMTAIGAWAATPVKLVDTKAFETSPAIADGWLAWSAWNASTGRFVAWVDPMGSQAARKIPTTSSAYMGDVLLDGPRTGQVVFWQFEGENGQVKFYDLDTGAILNAPPGINTPKSEAYVSASGDYLLFGRGPKGEAFVRQVLLYRFNTGKLTTVASATQAFMTADQVNGDYLVYTRKFDVYRHRISTGGTIRMPVAPDGRSNYYGSVLTDGTVFYVQGNARQCGKNTKIVRFRGGKVTTVASVADGIEIGHLNARKIGGDTHVVFRLVTCSTKKAGIYEIVL